MAMLGVVLVGAVVVVIGDDGGGCDRCWEPWLMVAAVVIAGAVGSGADGRCCPVVVVFDGGGWHRPSSMVT